MEKLGANSEKIEILPNGGIDTNEFHPAVEPFFKEKLGLEDKIVILFAGRFDRGKGLDFLAESIFEVVKKKKEAHFILCGSGPLEKKLNQQLSDINVRRYVTFIPWIPYEKMPHLHASADIFVYPSIPLPMWEEQFGKSIVEAMACGKPIVSTTSGAIPEVVVNRKTGLLVAPEDSRALRDSLLILIEDEKLRKKMGRAGRKRVEENYSHEVVAKKTAKFLWKIIESE
jgi:glycosyltransferase involved in cell wall biosynthesis